jgi:hypothetical protein
VLLLDPDSAAARQRAIEIGESPSRSPAGSGLRSPASANWLRSAANLEVACYDRLPVWRLIGIDSTLYVGTFVEAREGHQSPLYKLTASPVGMLQCGLRWTLEDLRKHAKRIIWIIICG